MATLCQHPTGVKRVWQHEATQVNRNRASGKRAEKSKAWQTKACIQPLEVNDSIFEFVFAREPRQDGSGESGLESNVEQRTGFHVERE
jgi:hypothetical protein